MPLETHAFDIRRIKAKRIDHLMKKRHKKYLKRLKHLPGIAKSIELDKALAYLDTNETARSLKQNFTLNRWRPNGRISIKRMSDMDRGRVMQKSKMAKRQDMDKLVIDDVFEPMLNPCSEEIQRKFGSKNQFKNIESDVPNEKLGKMLQDLDKTNLSEIFDIPIGFFDKIDPYLDRELNKTSFPRIKRQSVATRSTEDSNSHSSPPNSPVRKHKPDKFTPQSRYLLPPSRYSFDSFEKSGDTSGDYFRPKSANFNRHLPEDPFLNQPICNDVYKQPSNSHRKPSSGMFSGYTNVKGFQFPEPKIGTKTEFSHSRDYILSTKSNKPESHPIWDTPDFLR